MKINSILILGTGALATLFAARFAGAGIAVTMLGSWSEGLTAAQEKGVRVGNNGAAYRVHATNNPEDCKHERFALVLVKAWQTERAATQLLSCLPENGVALTLQNGLGNETILASTLGLTRVARGVTTLGATLLAPGVVFQSGEGIISVESHPRLALLEEMLKQAGFSVSVVKDVKSLVWGKMIVSSSINPLTALLRVKNGELLEHPTIKELMADLVRETLAVATTQGVELSLTDCLGEVEKVAQLTSNNQSSMLRDILRGAPTEIDAITGAIVNIAVKHGLAVPVNRTVWALIKAIPVRGKIGK